MREIDKRRYPKNRHKGPVDGEFTCENCGSSSCNYRSCYAAVKAGQENARARKDLMASTGNWGMIERVARAAQGERYVRASISWTEKALKRSEKRLGSRHHRKVLGALLESVADLKREDQAKILRPFGLTVPSRWQVIAGAVQFLKEEEPY